jgi:hypothetical protein
MTREQAKRELKPVKEIESDIRAVEQEIERLMALATKMTPSYGGLNVSGPERNRQEEAIIKINEYKSRLSKLVLDSIDYKVHCLNKVQQIQPMSLRKVLILYYFQNLTMEETAEELDRSERYTYTMYESALDEYCKII